MEKVLQRYVTRYLAVWELDIVQPPIRASNPDTNAASPGGRKQQRLIAAAREQADFLFSLLPLAPLKSGYHPAPGSCLWIYALIVDQIKEQPFSPTGNYEEHYRQLNNHQQQLERDAFVAALTSIPERTIEQLIQTGPAPYWVAKPLFPSPLSTHLTKETCSPSKIWRLNASKLPPSTTDNINAHRHNPIPCPD